MALDRGLYLAFYILYLITLAITIWFILYYGNSPGWVFIFFGVALLIAIFGVFIKEFLMKRIINTCGKDITSSSYTFWGAMYLILHIIAFVLIITGLVFAIQYSNIPWFAWLILFFAIFLSIVANMILAYWKNAIIAYNIIAALSFILFIISFILIIIYSTSPWWVWLLAFIALFFAILTVIFESLSVKNHIIVPVVCPNIFTSTVQSTPCIQSVPCVQPTIITKPCKEAYQQVKVVTGPVTTDIDTTVLPSVTIPEQVIL